MGLVAAASAEGELDSPDSVKSDPLGGIGWCTSLLL
jgi:hypothetical protein